MEANNCYRNFEPSISLVSQAQGHLAFLKEVDTIAPILEKPHVIADAVRRYETCWLPLLAAHKDEDLLPPLDVHWAWHVHMLSPLKYSSDITKICGGLFNHKFQILKEYRETAEHKTRSIWETMFPDEPFEADFTQIPSDFVYQATQVDYDIQSASSRQLQFNYNVFLPHFGLLPFLVQAKVRYMKFMYLKKMNRSAFLVPMYDIDLMWHTHQLAPKAYNEDCQSWLGNVLNHDDDINDRSPGSYRNECFANTSRLWKKTFNEEYAIPGVGYRGPDLCGKLFKLSREIIGDYRSKTARVRLDTLKYDPLRETSKLKGFTKVVHFTGKSKRIEKIELPTVEEEPFVWNENQPSGMCTFDVAPEQTCYLKIHLKSYKGLLSPLINGEKAFKSTLHATDKLQKAVDQGLTTTVHRTSIKEGSVTLGFSISKPRITDTAEFTLDQMPFSSQAVMPETAEAILGPVFFPRLPDGSNNKCHTAAHKLVNNNGYSVTVRIVHSLPLNMSIVQVLYQDRLAAISHLIGHDQLPEFEQIPSAPKAITLQKGERAMLVKNHSGDWAMIKAIWDTGSRPGHLKVNVNLLGRNQSTTFNVLKSYGCLYRPEDTFSIFGSKLNLTLDKLTINCENDEMVEHIATIFSALVLYTLCEPRRGDKPGVDRTVNPEKMRQKRSAHPSNYSFMTAAGYTVDTPSNSYLWWIWFLSMSASNHDSTCQTGDSIIHDPSDFEDSPAFCPWDPGNVGVDKINDVG